MSTVNELVDHVYNFVIKEAVFACFILFCGEATYENNLVM